MIDSKTWWAKTIHDTSSSRGPIAAISQSRTATGSKSRYITLPIRESPQHRTASSVSGRLASSQASARSTIGERPMSGTAKSYQARVAGEVRASSVAPRARGWPGRGTPNVVAASGIACSSAEHLDGGVLQPALVLDGRVVQPVVAEVVGQHVLRHDAVDPVHQEERRAEHRRRSAPSSARPARVRRSARRRSASRRTGPAARSCAKTGRSSAAGRDARDVLARALAGRPRSRRRRGSASPTTSRWRRRRCAA